LNFHACFQDGVGVLTAKLKNVRVSGTFEYEKLKLGQHPFGGLQESSHGAFAIISCNWVLEKPWFVKNVRTE